MPEKCAVHKGLVRDQQHILSDCTFSETGSFVVKIVRELELKFDATEVEIDDTRFLSCIPVASLAMEATYRYSQVIVVMYIRF